MNLKKWTTALTLCAVTLAASTTGIAPALAADDTAAVQPGTPNLQAAAQALNAANQHLSGGNVGDNANNSGSPNVTPDQPSDDTATLGYDYITLADPAITIDGQAYLPLTSTFAAMKSAALQVEWKPQNQQKIKLIGTDIVFELYLTADDTALQLQQGGTTYPINTQNGVTYVPMSFFQAIAHTATLELNGNSLLVLKDKDGTSVWDSNTPFWTNMNYYQAPPQNQTQPQQPDITVPDVDNNTNDTTTPEDTTPDTNTPAVPDINIPDNTIGGQLVKNALQYLGVPYVWGGTTPAGFDCSGLVQYVYAQCGISLPRVSYDQQTAATPISLVALQPGDLVFWGDSAYHVGIYIGDGMYIHAPAPGQNVKIQSYAEYPYTSAGRILY